MKKQKDSASSNRAASIGIIGGADGPTALFVSRKRRRQKEEQEQFLAEAAKKIIPCYRPFDQLETYLKEHYHAVPVALSQEQKENVKVNVILNHHREILVLPHPLGKHPSKRQLRRYAEEDTSFQQAREYPAERLGLDIRGYQLPEDGENEPCIVEVERKSQYICVQNDTGTLAEDLHFWQGVSEEDILQRTSRFWAYAYYLKKKGKL